MGDLSPERLRKGTASPQLEGSEMQAQGGCLPNPTLTTCSAKLSRAETTKRGLCESTGGSWGSRHSDTRVRMGPRKSLLGLLPPLPAAPGAQEVPWAGEGGG